MVSTCETGYRALKICVVATDNGFEQIAMLYVICRFPHGVGACNCVSTLLSTPQSTPVVVVILNGEGAVRGDLIIFRQSEAEQVNC